MLLMIFAWKNQVGMFVLATLGYVMCARWTNFAITVGTAVGKCRIIERGRYKVTLYELLRVTSYAQRFAVFVINAYDQNIPVGGGTRADLVDENETDAFDHLMDKVDMIRMSKDGETIIVFVRNEDFDKRAEELYSVDYVQKWDNLKPQTRPFRYFSEIDMK